MSKQIEAGADVVSSRLPTSDTTLTDGVQVRLSPQERAIWQQFARKEGHSDSTAAWVRTIVRAHIRLEWGIESDPRATHSTPFPKNSRARNF